MNVLEKNGSLYGIYEIPADLIQETKEFPDLEKEAQLIRELEQVLITKFESWKSKIGYMPLPKEFFKFDYTGLPLFRGDTLLELKVTHGFPMEFALTDIFANGLNVDWVEYVSYAYYRGYKGWQIFEFVEVALRDIELEREDKKKFEAIVNSLKMTICCVDPFYHHIIKTNDEESEKYKKGLLDKYCFDEEWLKTKETK